MLPRHNEYFFLQNQSGKFFYATYDAYGKPVIKTQNQPIPLNYSPANLVDSAIEFGTNDKYFSLNRVVSYPLKFIKDGADILRYCDYSLNGIETIVYLVVVEFSPSDGYYKLSYKGRIDFSKSNDDPKTGYTASTLDASAWSILQANETTQYEIECNAANPKAIRVLFDGIDFSNIITWQSIDNVKIYDQDGTTPGNYFLYPIVLISQDGDSAGVLTQTQTATNFPRPEDFAHQGLGAMYVNAYPSTINVQGEIKFMVGTNVLPMGGVDIFFFTTLDTLPVDPYKVIVNASTGGELQPGIVYSYKFDKTFTLAANEALFLMAVIFDNTARHSYIEPLVSNITISLISKSQPQVCYGLRAFDLLQQIVYKATNGLYSINSNYFTNENTLDACFGGDSIRQLPGAKIYSSFSDWFESFNPQYFLALRIINGVLWIEPATEVYKVGTSIFELGEINDLKLEHETKYYGNQVLVGSPKQDYRHSNGRYEFNSENKFSLPITTVAKTIQLVSKYRSDGFGIAFIILDLQNNGTTDNLGDTNTFMVRITNEIGYAQEGVESFVNVNVISAPTSPYVFFPYSGLVISNDKPTLHGISTPSTNIKIYVDGSLDGNVTSDSDGNWSYNIVTSLQSYEATINPDGSLNIIHTGEHVIDLTYTDETGILTTVNVIVNTTFTQTTTITNIFNGDGLFNNKPLIKGLAQAGHTVNLFVDGVLFALPIADGSGYWQYQMPVMSNASHTITADSYTITVIVNSFVSYPLVTSFQDGLPIISNLPLIEGVAEPFTVVTIYLNYISTTPLGTAVADSYGNWSFQVVPRLTPYDPQIPFIPDGLNIISTALVNQVVNVGIGGYKLDRPDFDTITGVVDNTVFNTFYSPKRMMERNFPMFASILNQQQTKTIQFQVADKNRNLSTTIGGVTVNEDSDINVSDLGDPLFVPLKASFTTRVDSTFNDIFYNFSNGGLIRGYSLGNQVWFLPIGTMKQNSITNKAQAWSLLLSTLNDYGSILQLSNNGILINIMKNSFYHSMYNSLHMVQIGYTIPDKYQSPELFDDWFANRNDRWVVNPTYIQKFNKTDVLRDQIVVNGLSSIVLRMFKCSDGSFVDSIPYNAVAIQPTPLPYITWEVSFDLTIYPEDQYFFTINIAGVDTCISERIQTKAKWNKTILFECTSTKNKTDFFYSTGIVSTMRIEGMVKKWQPEISIITNKDEIGDNQNLHSVPQKKRGIFIGNADGVPDFLYLKANLFVQLDNLNIEGVSYVLGEDSKFEPNEEQGYPMYYYLINVEASDNTTGFTFAGNETADVEGAVLVIDASAFGGPGGQLINIEIDNG